MIDRFQGDPRIIITENGAKIIFTGGQPIMDQGVENLALISLFTMRGWAGNVLFTDPNQKIGSDFIEVSREAITLKSLNKSRDAALKALNNPLFGTVEVVSTNPTSYQRKIKIFIKSPGQNLITLTLLKNGITWIVQGTDPANERTGGI